MKYLDMLELALSKAFMIVGGTALISLMILATGNVALRVFHIPYSGAYEIVSFLGAIVTASALGYTQRYKDHIVVDILSEKFPPEIKRAVNALSYLITTLFFAVVSWQTFVWGMNIQDSGELSETLKIIYHPFIFGVAAGFTMLTIACALGFLRTAFKKDEDMP
ncbi:MAG: TRAP transporter small permease [Syntrophaceae bacterium]